MHPLNVVIEIVLIFEPGTAYLTWKIPILHVLGQMPRQLYLQVELVLAMGTLKLRIGVTLLPVIPGLHLSGKTFPAYVTLDFPVTFGEVSVKFPVGVEHPGAVGTLQCGFGSVRGGRIVPFISYQSDIILLQTVFEGKFRIL